MVGSRCSFIRGIPFGRCEYFSCHAKRGRRGDARVALGKWTCYPHGVHRTGVAKKEVLFLKTCWLFVVVRRWFWCRNPLFAQFRPDLLHLPATVKSLRVTCLKNLLCLLSTGCFKGNNSVTAFMKFLGAKERLAYVCVLALRPTTDPRHRHARLCAVAARLAGKKRTRWPRQKRSRRVAPFIAVRVGEATHPCPLSTKHLRCPHCPTWLSHRGSLRNHILRFHEPPPPTPFPVMGEWSFSEADGWRRRQRSPRSREARQRRLGRGEPNTIGHEEFTILHSNVRGFISQVAELSSAHGEQSVRAVLDRDMDRQRPPIHAH